jgi:hypothetical protein
MNNPLPPRGILRYRGCVPTEDSHGSGCTRSAFGGVKLRSCLAHIIHDRRSEENVGLSFGVQWLIANSIAVQTFRNRSLSLSDPLRNDGSDGATPLSRSKFPSTFDLPSNSASHGDAYYRQNRSESKQKGYPRSFPSFHN